MKRTSLRSRIGVLLLCAAFVTHARAGEEAAAPEKPSRADAAAYVSAQSALEDLGRWCDEAQLFARRERVAEALLVLDPDHENAREWLGYRRQKDGWKRGAFPPAADLVRGSLPEWESRRDALSVPFRNPDAKVSRDLRVIGLRDRVSRALVEIAPDDAALRDRAGETNVSGRWILKESAATPAGRKRIAEAVREAKQNTLKVKPVFVKDPDWLCVLTAGGLTVRSAFPKSDAEEIAHAVRQARELFGRVFATDAPPPEDLSVRLFADYAATRRFLDARPDLGPKRRDQLAELTSYWVSDHEIVSRRVAQPDRVDACVRLAISNLETELGRMYLAADWMGEGIGMYLTHALVGTRLTVFVRDTPYSDDALSRELSDPRTDWVAAAKRMVDRGFDPKITALVGTPLNSMTKDDGLMAFALAAYFLESRPIDAKQLVEMTQSGGANFHAALAAVCGMDAQGLEYRFVRWLRETR